MITGGTVMTGTVIGGESGALICGTDDVAIDTVDVHVCATAFKVYVAGQEYLIVAG